MGTEEKCEEISIQNQPFEQNSKTCEEMLRQQSTEKHNLLKTVKFQI